MSGLQSRAAETVQGVSGVALVLAVAAAVILALVLAELVTALTRRVARRWLVAHLVRRTRVPTRLLLVVGLIWAAVRLVARREPADASWREPFDQTMAAGVVVLTVWLLAVVIIAVADAALDRHRPDEPGARYARGGPAQSAVVRRSVGLLATTGGLAGVLLVVEPTRPAGWVLTVLTLAMLALIGVTSLPWLRGVLAGLQLAATDAVRVDDVVVVDGQWGRVEALTAGYLLVQTWDDRRLVVPMARLTSETFENWTRRSADLVGTVELDVDVGVPIADLRAELTRLLQTNDLWDRRVAVLQVTDATAGWIRVTAVVSAADVPRLMDLRCDVREALVAWLQRRAGVLPARADQLSGPSHRQEPGDELPNGTVRLDPRRDARLFTGSVFAAERSQMFTGPGEDVQAERDLEGPR
jgi:small-conductance mechanosensitive channel